MKRTLIISGALLALAGFTLGHDIDRADGNPQAGQQQAAEHIRGTVDVYGYVTNPQFLYTLRPALVGRDLHLTLMYTDHTAGTYSVMFSSVAQPDGPYVSIMGGPACQIMIGAVDFVLGPFAHDGVQSDLTIAIPANPALLGRSWFAQAIVTGGFVDLSSAVGGVIGNYM